MNRDYVIPTEEQLKLAPWMRPALGWLGLREADGDGDNPIIVSMIRECAPSRPRLWRDSTPHCSAFVNFCMKTAGFKGTGSLAARSWLRWGTELRPQEARYGDVVVLWRGVPMPGPVGPGHVGFLDHIEGGMVHILGANQKNRVGVDPYSMRRVLQFRRVTAKLRLDVSKESAR